MPTTKTKIKKTVVCFVCTGNTCRSPVAERLFKSYLKKEGKNQKFRVFSLGLMAFEGKPMSIHSQTVLKNNKIPHSNHKAKILSERIKKTTDFFVCMTQDHENALLESLKSGVESKAKVVSIKTITGGTDVVDPYGGKLEDYANMYTYVEYAMQDVLKYIEIENNNKIIKEETNKW